MQKNKNKPVILGEKMPIMLWGFKVTLKDRRAAGNDLTDGYIVVTGDEEYDLDAAERQIRERYGRLGYTVTACVYDETRVFNFDAVQLFKQSKCNRCGTCEYYIRPDSSVGLDEGCQLADEAEDNGDIEMHQTLAAAFSNNGCGCNEYERVNGRTRDTEDAPDFLAECMAALEELEEEERDS